MSFENISPEASSSSLSLDRYNLHSPRSKWLTSDPRTNSTQSIAPSTVDENSDDTRHRRLLLVYIHGYQGTNRSFKEFPFHVHQYLKLVLTTHVIHTKIYPRYKTYRSIDVARDNLSAWLEPHESDNTDIILIGHSMGGILAAEVALKPNTNPYSRHPYKHRILGTLSLDAPFLGLHPGIIVSGLASLLKPASGPPKPKPQETTDSVSDLASIAPAPSDPPSSASSFVSLQSSHNPDPTFNPPFFNDVPFKERPLKERLVRFVAKNRTGIVDGVVQHLQSHLEYGACLTDYAALNRRYSRLRNLENVDDLASLGAGRSEDTYSTGGRVRFANYYTVCVGKPADQKSCSELEPGNTAVAGTSSPGSSSTPKISVEDCSDEIESQAAVVEPESGDDTLSRALKHAEISAESLLDEIEDQTGLPSIPDVPEPPTVPDLDEGADDQTRRRTEKEAKKAQKVYEHQVKTREKVIRDRDKVVAKREKQREKDALKQAKQQQKLKKKKEELASKAKRVKERKFCTIPWPPNDGSDETWVKVFMGNVDEIVAHCGLFLQGPHYEALVTEVGSRIIRWIQDDMTKRAIMELPPD